MSNENSVASPHGSDNMDIDDSIVKSLDESEIESNNARRRAEQFASLMSAAAAAAAATNAKKPYHNEINAMGNIYTNNPLPEETNGLNFEDMIPLSKTKIPQMRGDGSTSGGGSGVGAGTNSNNVNGLNTQNFNNKISIGSSDSDLPNNSIDHMDKRPNRSVDDCDFDKIAEIVAKTVSGHKTLGSGLSTVDNNGMCHDSNQRMPSVQAKLPTCSSPIPGIGAENLYTGNDKDYKTFENDLSSSRIGDVTDGENVGANQTSQSKKNDMTNDGKANNHEEAGESKTDGDATAAPATTTNKNGAQRSKSTKKPAKKGANKGGASKNKKGSKNGGKNHATSKVDKKAKTKEETAAAEALNKFRGPYLQIERDGTETVINAPMAEEVADKQGNKKKMSFVQNMNDRNKIRGLHVSTLSNKYDAATTDKSWMCVFCKLGPHKYGLGDLFGPYILSTHDEDFQLSQIDPSEDLFRSHRTKLTMLQSRGMSFAMAKQVASAMANGNASPKPSTSTGKGRKRRITEADAGVVTSPIASPKDVPDIYQGMTKVTDDSYEVWVHEDCIVWSSGVHLIGVRIVGLEAAVWSSSRHQCSKCAQYGAILSCLHRGCSEVAHFICAKRAGWQLNELEFNSRCNDHFTDAKPNDERS